MGERATGYRKRFSSRTVAVLAGLIVAGAGGCAGEDAPGTNTTTFRLDFGGGVTLTSADYRIQGPNNFRRVGTIDVGADPIVTATFQNLPPGQGYNIQVKGTGSDDATVCQGEMTFTVTASMTATLQIPLTCSGFVGVTATLNTCPVIDGLSAIPSEVRVGATIDIVADVHDDDGGPQPLSAIWQTDGGGLSNLSTAGATFTCSAAGTFTVGLKISDGDMSSNASKCADTAKLMLLCTPAS